MFRPTILVALLSCAFLSSKAQINCPPNLPLTLLGNTSYCIGSNGSELSVQQNYAGYEWLPTSEIGQSVLLTAGDYQLVVTHYTGCTDTLDITVVQVSNPPQPIIDVQGPTEFCDGENVVLSAPAGYPFYEWNSGSVGQNLTVFESGTYVVSVTDWIGCTSASNSVQVIVNALPVAAFSPNLNGYDVSFLNLSENATSYEWHFGDGSTSTEFEPAYTYTSGGNMPLYLVATNDCTSDTAFYDLQSVSVDEKISEMTLEMYPNPCTSLVTLSAEALRSDNGSCFVRVFSVDGRSVSNIQIPATNSSNRCTMDVSGLANGMYLVQVQSGNIVIEESMVVNR